MFGHMLADCMYCYIVIKSGPWKVVQLFSVERSRLSFNTIGQDLEIVRLTSKVQIISLYTKPIHIHKVVHHSHYLPWYCRESLATPALYLVENVTGPELR